MKNKLSNEFRFLMRKHQTIVRDYLGELGLYMGQPRVLFRLDETPGISQKKLSEMLDISKEATSVSIRRLEKSGFINRKECVDDRRINLLSLSKKGKEIVSDLRVNFDEINNYMFIDLNKEDKEELSRLLTIMNNSLEKRLIDEETI